MTVWALGINHNTAPLDLRGRFSFALDQVQPLLWELRQRVAHATATQPEQLEAALVSTCNRTEIYCASALEPSAQNVFVPTLDWLAQLGQAAQPELSRFTYQLQDDTAARHAFRVASGLDSMVLGEPQILGQMKSFVRAANEAGTLGSTLNQMFQRSFAIAKEVRSQTEIGSHSISMAASCVRLCAQLFENVADCSVLLIGAGEMIELVATHFAAKGPKRMAVANRTLARGEKLAKRIGAQTLLLSDLPQQLAHFDVVISCTASSLPLIGLGAVQHALQHRKHRPMLMVDLAVPRDIEAEVKHLSDVYLYTVDDLASLVQINHQHRQAAVAQAEAIVDAGVQSFMHWVDARNPAHGSVSMIQRLQTQGETWRQAELARAHKLLAKGENPDQVLEALSKGLVQKLLHGAMSELHNADLTDQAQLQHMLTKLFLRQSTGADAAINAHLSDLSER